MFPHYEETTSLGTIITIKPHGVIIHYDDPDLGVLPLPIENSEVVVTSITLLGQSLLKKPIQS